MKALKVLSLFDGISCGLLALKNLEIEVAEYHAFEIEESAIKISKKNHPEVLRYGDVMSSDFKEFEGVDLLLGGSPCQDLSINKTGREGLKGSKSCLFWKYKEALDNAKPRYFLFENVASMKDEDRDIISDALGVKPILINATDYLPQNRERYYWTNIPIEKDELNNKITTFRGLMLQDVPNKYYYNKDFTLFEDKTKNVIGEIHLNTIEVHRRVFNPDGIIGCLTCVSGGYQEKKVFDDRLNKVRKITPVEYERLQGLPDDYTAGICDSKRYTVCGNGWAIPVIERILKGLKQDGTD